MPTAFLLSPAIWLPSLLVLAMVGYVLYQVSSYRRLRRLGTRLSALKLRQRQLYRRLEAVGRRLEALSVRVPHAVRPAPYAQVDEQAIAVHSALAAAMEELQRDLRPVGTCSLSGWRLGALLLGRYPGQARACARELAVAEGLLQRVTEAESLADQLDGLLSDMGRKPLLVQRGLAEVQALAEALAQEVVREARRGTEGLLPLQYEVQSVRATAMAWVERLRTGSASAVAQLAVEAEGVRLALLDKLAQEQARAERVTGMHNQALSAQERLAKALAGVETMVAALRPELCAALRPALQALRQERQDLALRYREHSTEAYDHVSRQSWVLLAQVRALGQRVERLGQADRRAAQAVEECGRALADLRERVQAEGRQTRTNLDVTQAALQRAEQAMAQLRALYPGSTERMGPATEAEAVTALGNAEAQAERCWEEIRATLESLTAWQTRRRRLQEAQARLQAAEGEHQRFVQAWQDLQQFSHSNWPQVDPGWYEQYAQARAAIVAEAAQLWGAFDRGELCESQTLGLDEASEGLVRRWQALAQQGQWVVAALSSAQATQRQVVEGLNALQCELQGAALIGEGLPDDLMAAPLRELTEAILARYRALEDAALRPAQADYRRLRDEELRGLQDQLAAHAKAYAQLVEDERADLKQQMLKLYARWAPLGQRMARAVPATDVDWRPLGRRLEALLRTTRGASETLSQVMGLKAQVETLAKEVEEARAGFASERRAVREAEKRLARAREEAARRRGYLPRLLAHPHPQVVDEEWARSTKAWGRSDAILRELQPHRGTRHYLARLNEASAQYEEAAARARSALVRALRYAFLEDPVGMHQTCEPLSSRWKDIGMAAREEHIRDLLGDLEQAGDEGRLVERVTAYLDTRRSAG